MTTPCKQRWHYPTFKQLKYIKSFGFTDKDLEGKSRQSVAIMLTQCIQRRDDEREKMAQIGVEKYYGEMEDHWNCFHD